jgi:hypothetical protein
MVGVYTPHGSVARRCETERGIAYFLRSSSSRPSRRSVALHTPPGTPSSQSHATGTVAGGPCAVNFARPHLCYWDTPGARAPTAPGARATGLEPAITNRIALSIRRLSLIPLNHGTCNDRSRSASGCSLIGLTSCGDGIGPCWATWRHRDGTTIRGFSLPVPCAEDVNTDLLFGHRVRVERSRHVSVHCCFWGHCCPRSASFCARYPAPE